MFGFLENLMDVLPHSCERRSRSKGYPSNPRQVTLSGSLCIRDLTNREVNHFLPYWSSIIDPIEPFLKFWLCKITDDPNVTRLCQSLPNFAKLCQTLPDFARLCQTLPDFVRRCQTLPDFAKLCQTLLDFARLCQTLPNFREPHRCTSP